MRYDPGPRPTEPCLKSTSYLPRSQRLQLLSRDTIRTDFFALDSFLGRGFVNTNVRGTTRTIVLRYFRETFRGGGAEVNSNQIPLPGVTTAAMNLGNIQASGNASTPGNDWTTDFQAIQCYDQLKVNAVVNWMNGKAYLGTSSAPVPTIFGMNFQAVSVGEKLIENGVFGGYTDAAGDATPESTSEIVSVDPSIGQMVTALKNQGLLN